MIDPSEPLFKHIVVDPNISHQDQNRQKAIDLLRGCENYVLIVDPPNGAEGVTVTMRGDLEFVGEAYFALKTAAEHMALELLDDTDDEPEVAA